MNTLFDNDMRALNESELIYKVTNRREFSKQKEMTFEEILESLTPARKEVAEAAIELYKRFSVREAKRMQNSQDIFNFMNPVLSDLNHEEFWVVCLNQASRVIRRKRISSGAIAATAVDVRLLMKEAISCCAVAIIVLHNHPSGAITPSREDDSLTDRIAKAGKLLDIRLVDHVIIGNGMYYSFADEGKI